MLTRSQTCLWEVSEQGSRQHAVCAKCNQQFASGDLRLRPSGTRNTRLIHPHCTHGIVNSLADISNLADLSVSTRQRLDRSLALAPSSHGAAGDVGESQLTGGDCQLIELLRCHESVYCQMAKTGLQVLTKGQHVAVMGA